MDKYEVYSCLLPAGSGLATIILSTRKAGRFWHGEYFIVLHKDCVLYMDEFQIDERAFAEPPAGIQLNAEFVLEQTKMRCEEQLYAHLNEAYENTGNSEFVTHEPIWRESNHNRLVHLWMSRLCRDQIRSVAQQTRCEKLNHFLDWLIHRP